MITGMPRIAIAVDDFEAVVTLFRDKLGMPVVDISEASVANLGAKLAMCVPKGGSNIELMCPAEPAAPLSQSLQRFLDRRGQGPFALMLEAPDPNAEADVLTERGLNVLPLMAGAGGRDIHPNSTHGVLIRVYPVDSFKPPAEVSTPATTLDLSGVERVIIAVRDATEASAVFGSQLAMDLAAPVEDADRGVRSVICTPPSGGKIELVSASDRSRPFAKAIADFVENDREGMYALVLRSRDLPGLAASLKARDVEVAVSADSPDVLEVARSSAFGALLRIEG